jgi:hypothetical protein
MAVRSRILPTNKAINIPWRSILHEDLCPDVKIAVSPYFLLLADVIIRHMICVEDDNILDEQYNTYHRTLPRDNEVSIPAKQRTAKMMKAVLNPCFPLQSESLSG